MTGDSPDPSASSGATVPHALQTEYRTNPENAPRSRVRFSWQLTASADDERPETARQTAYQLLLARSPGPLERGQGTVLDTGKVESSRSTDVVPELDLKANVSYHWTVRVWNGNGDPSPFADPATFTTGLGGSGDWDGEWIGYGPDGGDANGYRSRWRPADDQGTVDSDELDEGGDTRGSADATEWVQVDLGEVATIDTIDLYPAAPPNGPETPDGMRVSPFFSEATPDSFSHAYHVTKERAHGFGFPRRYRVDVADDAAFTDATTVADRTDADQSSPGAERVELDAGRVEGRYVRIVATEPYVFDPFDAPQHRHGDAEQFENSQYKSDLVRESYRAWQTFALAGLAVRDDEDRDLARGQPVAASSSAESEDWSGAYLVDGSYGSTVGSTSPQLRTTRHFDQPVTRARAHVATLGYGELYVNGEKVGKDVLNPGWTAYDERVLYSTNDVTDRFQKGSNAVGLWLGRGWFSKSYRDWVGFGSPRALLQVDVEFADGTTTSITTSSDWAATESPIVANDIFDGERYDARLENPSWTTAEFNDRMWDDAIAVDGPGGELRPQCASPIRVTDELMPERIENHEEGYVVDMGQNFAGWIRLQIPSASAGDEITISYAESLVEDGWLSTVDLRDADATDTYVASGESDETYEPRFTYHGFRYVGIRGYPGELSPDDVIGQVVHTAMDRRGSFDCSSDELSQIQDNAVWGFRSNVHSVPTDCPQRDERFGWTGDGRITANAVLYNFDAVGLYEKWLGDHVDDQSVHGYLGDTVPYGHGTQPGDPVWTHSLIEVPWLLYCHYGNRTVLASLYESQRRFVDYWDDVAEDHLLPAQTANYGDWIAFEEVDLNDERRGQPLALFATAYHYRSTDFLARIADTLGRDADARRYAGQAESIRDAFNDRFFDIDAGTYRPRTQAAQAVPLEFGIVPEDSQEAVVETLVEKVQDEDDSHLQCGFVGARSLLRALSEYGHVDIAYDVVTQPTSPGWLYMVREGATTMWERWNSDERVGSGMNSLNHPTLGFVSEFFYESLAGIRPRADTQGFAESTIAPAIVDNLDWVEASIETPYGQLSSAWERVDNGVSLDLTVPCNTKTTYLVPLRSAKTIELADRGVVFSGGLTATDDIPGIDAGGQVAGTRSDISAVAFNLEPGRYRFRTY